MKEQKPTLDEIRRKVTPFQKELLQETWQHFKAASDWPLVRKLYSDHGRQKVKKALTPLGGNVGREERGPTRWSKYQLSLIGVLLTKDGLAFENLLERFFKYQRDLFQKSPLRDFLAANDVASGLGLNKEETATLGQLLFLGQCGGSPQGDWGVNAMDEAEKFPSRGDLFAQVEEWLFRYYHPNLPVFIEDQIRAQQPVQDFSDFSNLLVTPAPAAEPHPPEIAMSLSRLRSQYPDRNKLGFLVMRFTKGEPFERITEVIKRTAKKYNLAIIRADEIQYHDDVFGNVRTLLHGCGFGVAIYERIETEDFNANIGLEVGYLMAMNKPVLLLKDKNIRTLQADLAGKLYKEFDPNEADKTIPDQLFNWLKDNGIIVSKRA